MKFFQVLSISLSILPLLVSGSVSETTENSIRGYLKRSTASMILNEIEHAATCTACEALLVVLKVLAHTGNNNFVSVITDVCIASGTQDADVCKGAIALEGPILAHDLRVMSIGSRTSQLFCLTVFGLCQWPSIQPYTVSMSPKPNKGRPAPSGKTPLKIVHISDIHVDLSYEVGASYNCTKNICCRPYTSSDAPGNNAYPAGEYGNTACDSPLSLEESLYTAVKSLVPDRSFTIFTGDIVEGAVWAITDTEVGEDINDAYSKMQGLKSTVYGVVGNHDSCPVNSFPPPAVDTTITSQWVYNNISNDLQPWIGAGAAAEVKNNYGSYSAKDSSGVRIISVNTNFWYKQNFWMYEKTMEQDPAGLFAWMVSELEAAETAGERVWLMGHMPLGASDAFHDQSQYFGNSAALKQKSKAKATDQIIQRFDATIAAVFFGHTHKDEFEIAYSDYTNQVANTATMVAYIAPALTPTSGNPTFRVYSVDPVTFAVLDYSVYYTNISSPTYQSGPTWELLYSAKETYGPLVTPPVTDPTAELTPSFWHSLTTLFENNDAVFQAYYSRKSRDYFTGTCTGTCKTSEICQLRAMQSQYNCGTVTAGIHFKRNEEEGSGHRHVKECEGSAVVPILSQLSGNGIDAFSSALTKHLGDEFLDMVVSEQGNSAQ